MHILSKSEAWSTVPKEKEVFLPIDKTGFDFKFRRRWFHLRNCCTFSTFLPERFPADRPWNVLSIGVFEGMTEVWLMQNILKHKDSRVVSIDPWLETTKLDSQFMEECYQNAQSNLRHWLRKVHLIRGRSQEVLHQAVEQKNLVGFPLESFDLVIIDGDHNKIAVYDDASLAFEFCKPGGWLLFDDVRLKRMTPDQVLDGLKLFLAEYGDDLEFVWAHRHCDCYKKL